MSNWENPLRGVPDLVEEVLRNVLAACAKGDPKEFQDLLSSLWKSNLENISWLSKSKYPPMVVLLPRIGVEEVFIKIIFFCYSGIFDIFWLSGLNCNHFSVPEN